MPAPARERPQLLSVVFSFRNEEEVLPELVRRTVATVERAAEDYELIFVDDASTDASAEVLRGLSVINLRTKVISMSRRFGVSECQMAGLERAQGEVVVYLDADLQDPPELIASLVDRWREGFDVVHTVRTRRRGEPRAKLVLTALAYRLIRLVSRMDLLVDAGDFKLLSRRAVDALTQLGERTPYMRGLAVWIGFEQTTIEYVRAGRAAGRTKFGLFTGLGELRGPLGTLVVALTSFSFVPVLFFLLLGGLLLVTSLLTLTALSVAAVRGWSAPPGAWLLSAAVLLSAVHLLGVGTLGVYLGRIYQEVRNRPRYLVAESWGFETASAGSQASSAAGTTIG